jgi:hypothetical protein
VLALAALLASAGFGELVALFQFGMFFFEIHVRKDYSGWDGQVGVGSEYD